MKTVIIVTVAFCGLSLGAAYFYYKATKNFIDTKW
jgi:preprotein translocase subunit SecG